MSKFHPISLEVEREALDKYHVIYLAKINSKLQENSMGYRESRQKLRNKKFSEKKNITQLQEIQLNYE